MTDRRWPIEPVVDYLKQWLGEMSADNMMGYSSAAVERLTGVHRTSWQRWVARGWLTDKSADRIATRLGHMHEVFWPDWNDLPMSAADMEWYNAWLAGEAVS
jgi:hypothetical protein